MRNWKRIIAAVGTAALLISNLGTVSQAVFATENYTENAEPTEENHDGDEGTENLTSESGDTNGGENVVTMNVADLLGGTGEGSGSVTLAPVSENGDEHPAGGTDANPSDAPGATGDDESGSGDANTDTTGGTTPGTQDGGSNGSDNVGGDESQGQQGEGSNDDSDGVDDADGNDKGESTDGTDTGTDTSEDPDITPANPEDPDDSGNDDPDKTYALNDSLQVTLETKESGNHDVKRGDNGDYLYNLGETASTTVTLTNPADYRLDETDGAVLHVYMQFKDTAATDIDGVPYKDETKVNEDVAAADVADLIANDAAVSGTSESQDATDTSVTPATDTSKASPHNGSTAGTKKAGEDTVQAESGTSYTYTVIERGDGLYEYEFQRPISGDTYSVELTSTYSKETTGGSNKIWAEIIPGEDDSIDENPTEATSSEDENTVDAETSDENTSDTEGTADTETSEEQTSESQESKQPKAELVKIDGQTLRWVADVNLVNKRTTQTAETENYTVSVTYGADSQLPAEAELRVTEYGPETEVYQRITEQTGETYDWLLDISFYYNELQLEPQAPVSLKVVAKTTELDEDKEDNVSTASLNGEDAEDTGEADLDNAITTITHFADTGTEVIDHQDIDVSENDDGLLETSFELSSLSLVAGTTYHVATVVKHSEFTYGNSYLIYTVSGSYVYYLAAVSGEPVTFRVPLSDIAKKSESATAANMTDLSSTTYYTGSIKGETVNRWGYWTTATLNWNNLIWYHSGGSGVLQNKATSGYNYLWIRDGELSISWWQDTPASQGSQTKYTRFHQVYSGWSLLRGSYTDTYYLRFNGTRFTGGTSTSGSDLTIAKVSSDTYTEPTEHVPGSKGEAVYTGVLDKTALKFYSVCIKTENNKDTLEPLTGVTYTFYDEAGNPVATYVTDDSIVIDIEEVGLPKGTAADPKKYTMKMTSVPEGYLCDGDTWSFSYYEGQTVLNMKNSKNESEGIIVINPKSNMTMNKTAAVVDYVNRQYKINLNAHSDLKVASIDGLTMDFIVDQSNSMLFPSGLIDTGMTLKIKKTSKTDKNNNYIWEVDSSSLTQLDRDRVYYIVVAEDTSATVMAIFYNQNADSGKSNAKEKGMWCYQDAGEYAVAYYTDENPNNGATKYRLNTDRKQTYPINEYDGNKMGGAFCYWTTDKDTPTKYAVSGSIVGDLRDKYNSVGSHSYKIYTASNEYNRLHYLEQSMCDLLQMLAAMYPQTRVTLDKFTYEFKGHTTASLDDEGLQTLLSAVENITTAGGTRQDKALQQSWNDHIQYYTGNNNYVVLITDGAPAGQSVEKIGTATDTVGNGETDNLSSSNTIYMNLNYWAEKVQSKATLVTIGLSMDNVESGKKAMRHISTKGPSAYSTTTAESGEWWFQPKNTEDLIDILTKKLFNQIVKTRSQSPDQGTVIDYISDSFYPVDQNGEAVTNGTRIDSNGNVVDSGGNGSIYQDTDGSWYVQWDQTEIASPSTAKFEGAVYIKAKEDFIGGNAINTNKSATLTLTSGNKFDYDLPNVNVRLLPMDGLNTEVTVYLGDEISAESTIANPKESIKHLFNSVTFQKIKSGKGDVLNKVGVEDKVGESTFSIGYATNEYEITDERFKYLTDPDQLANVLIVPYTYNDDDGEVGSFLITLTKDGNTADYNAHTATVAKGETEAVETYTLKVVYYAYKLGESGRPPRNQYNGETYDDNGNVVTPGQPGQEVGGTGNDGTLETGYGQIEKSFTHKVYVIDGTIEIYKEIEKNLVSDEDLTFTFTLQQYIATQGEWGDYKNPDTGQAWTQTITVPAGQTKGSTSIKWEHLPRGTYQVVETIPQDNLYKVKQIDVTSDTNTYFEGSGTASVMFKLGYETKGTNKSGGDNVIGLANNTENNKIYTSWYKKPNGILGVATFTNSLNKYELPATGSSGTLPYQLGGSAALLTSMIAGCSMWRRRRDGRRCG